MADRLTLRGVKRIENYVEPTDPSDRIVTLKRPTTGKDQFTIKRWWNETASSKRYVNVTAFDIARSGADLILAVVSNQDTRLTFKFDDSTTALTFGLSLPVGSISRVNIGIETGKRGNINKLSIKENYLKFIIGSSINNVWFIKRKFD